MSFDVDAVPGPPDDPFDLDPVSWLAEKLVLVVLVVLDLPGGRTCDVDGERGAGWSSVAMKADESC